jgi:4-diphosphocytidyl-2-C-methyl-D-erythritol kinase
MNKSYVFPSPAKINLFLHVVGRRSDGYHELETLFQFIDLCDQITISVNANNKIALLTDFPNVAAQDNLIMKAATLLQQHTDCKMGANISINKILPMGGGLGGGSSNAATVLVALNKLWRTNLSTEKLCELGLTLGADVPIFIHGIAAFAQGVGEKFTPANPIEYWYLISKPNCNISTQSIFQSELLPRNTAKLMNTNTLESDVFSHYQNDCETPVIKQYPEVAKLLSQLIEYAPSRMTGTGSCIFSAFNSEVEAKKCQHLLPNNIVSFVAKGLNHSPLLHAINTFDH